MWDKLMGKVWSFWNIAEYRLKVAVFAVIIGSAVVTVNEIISAALGKWSVGDVLMMSVSLTLCIYFICFAIKHRQEWHGKYDDEPFIEVDLWK